MLKAFVALILSLFSVIIEGFKSVFSVLLKPQMGSFTIPENFVEGFSETIYMLSQQKTPRMFGKSRVESQSSETDNYERLAPTEANDILDRHGDTKLANSPHSRRSVILEDADWADLIDRKDDLRLLIDPTNAYTMNANMALNRKKDDVFIAAALGIARAGKKGTISVSLPNSQKLVSVNEDGVSGSAKFSVFVLTLMLERFEDNDIDEDIKKYFAWSSKVKQQLLQDTKATSSDFATVRALVNGQINEYMGFDFIRSQRLPVTAAATTFELADGSVGTGAGVLAAGARRCVAWVEDGMISSIGEELFVDVGVRRDKRLSKQIYLSHSVGAVRMEEEKVLEVLVDETL